MPATRSRTTRSGASQAAPAPTKKSGNAVKTSTPAAKKNQPKAGSKRKAPADEIKQEPPATGSQAKISAKRTKVTNAKAEPDLEEGARIAAKIGADLNGSTTTATSSPAKSKKDSYNHTAGESPYATFKHPTPEECRNVNDLLAAVHGEVIPPKIVPPPSLKSAGCGEVPSVLDALIRTRLSAATNGDNSTRAFVGLANRFGIIKEGVGKGSVNWDAVRRAPLKDVYDAIKTGGLADVKSRDIQKILNLVYEENKAGAGGHVDDTKGGKTVLSLDHMHNMDSKEAFDKLVEYPGIGLKTASCVLLFCLQRPSFAVDTHVFRLVTWLGWMPSEAAVRRMAKEAKADGKKPPPPPSRNTAFSHLDVRIPDNLKYSLHQFFIRHGKACPSCAAKKDAKIRENWGDKKCPLAALKNGKGVTAAIKEAGKTEPDIKEEEGDSSEE